MQRSKSALTVHRSEPIRPIAILPLASTASNRHISAHDTANPMRHLRFLFPLLPLYPLRVPTPTALSNPTSVSGNVYHTALPSLNPPCHSDVTLQRRRVLRKAGSAGQGEGRGLWDEKKNGRIERESEKKRKEGRKSTPQTVSPFVLWLEECTIAFLSLPPPSLLSLLNKPQRL